MLTGPTSCVGIVTKLSRSVLSARTTMIKIQQEIKVLREVWYYLPIMAVSPFLQRLVRHPLWPYFVVLVCILMLAFAAYAVYLDRIVRARFEGARWSLPAQVYARPLELYPGMDMSAEGFKRELERLGYRSTGESAGPGTFAVSGRQITVNSREFLFWDGRQPARKLHVNFSENSVQSATDAATKQALQTLRLDPLLIGSIYPAQGEDRVLVRLKDVPELLPKGLILIEDRRFYKHNGVDPRSILRATFANVMAGHVVQGGSTITQQLVKNFYLDNRQTYGRKFNEAIMALLLESHFRKQEILETYINEVYLGQDGNRAIHGFGLGSLFYFNKPLGELQPHEMALLIAIVKGPSHYDPRRRPERVIERRNLVLDELAGDGLITPEQATTGKKRPLGVSRRGSGTSQYPAFVELVRRQLKLRYKDNVLTTEGLRIFTTLDPQVQSAIEKHVTEGLVELEKARGMKAGTLQSAAVVTSTSGGEVLGLVGGRDPRFIGFNRALDARRQIGSLAKPFVYLTALARPQEFNLLTAIDDDDIEVPQPDGSVWEPKNYDNDTHGWVDLHQALSKSYNIPTVKIALQVGMPAVISTIRRLGHPRGALPVPAVALGAIDMAPIEVAQLYNTLATGGYYSPLLAIREVMTQQGKPLGHYTLRSRSVFPEAPVYLLNWALERVMHHGTATGAYRYLPKDLRVAGKTGTTNDLRDSWFAGFSGNRVGVVWVGRDDNQPGRLTGANGALPLWARIMRDSDPREFAPAVPEDVEFFPFDAEDNDHDGGCDGVTQVPFLRGSLPEDFVPCDGRKDDSGGILEDLFGDGEEESRDEEEPRQKKKSNWFWDLFD
jgi:penicillin-binding protein 1B